MKRSSYEELLSSPVGALTRYIDADGRPLCGEALITDRVFRESLELKRCPYVGSRRHHALPMNVSALKQMTRHWGATLETARFICAAVGQQGESGTTWDLVRTAYAAMCLPLYLLFRAQDTARDGEVPGFVSGLHKASIDIATAAQLMLLHQHCDSGSTTTLLEFVEDNRLFIGPLGVCAGPPHMILELISAMTRDGVESQAMPHADPRLGDLSGLVAYSDTLLALAVARTLSAAFVRRRLDELLRRVATLDVSDARRHAFHRALQNAIACNPAPVRPSEILQRQERKLRDMRRLVFAALIELVAHHHEVYLRCAVEETSRALLAKLRSDISTDLGDMPNSLRVAAAQDPWTSEIARQVVDASHMEHLMLRFCTSIEKALQRSLGLPEVGEAFSSEQLARVLGTSPAQFLGKLIGVRAEISQEHVAYFSVTSSPEKEPLHVN